MKESQSWHVFLAFFSALGITSCAGEQLRQLPSKPQYDGPVIEFRQVETLYSDNAVIQLKIEASQQYIFQNGDVKYPKGVKIIRYDAYGKRISSLQGDSGSYDKMRQLYQAFGNIVVENIPLQQRLYTTQLDWDQTKREIRTDKPVKIVTPNEVLEGTGLVSDESFTNYRILQPKGMFNLNPK